MELITLFVENSQNIAITIVFLFVSIMLFRDGIPWLSEVAEKLIDRYIDLQYAQMETQQKNDERMARSLEQLVSLTNLIDKRSSQVEAMVSLLIEQRIYENEDHK